MFACIMMKSVAPVPLTFNSFNSQKPIFHTNDFHFLRDPDNSAMTLQDLQKYNWTSNEQSAQEFLDCIVKFVTYNGCYIPACFQILVQGFIPKKSKDSEFDLELSDRISHLIHGTLQQIITLIPLSLPLVGIALKDEFPHKRFNSEELFVYLKNLLLVSYYAPSLIDTLITTAVDHLIQIDVDIKLEDVPDTEELQFEVELEPGNSELTARKLDSMMIVVFEFLDAAFGNCKNENREHTFPSMNLNTSHKQQLFNILLQIFDKYILTTYKSKYTQFILFYVCRLKPEEDNSFSARFMAYLFNKLQMKGNNVHQMASAAYLGSFLARSNYVPASTLREVVAFIMNWTLSYLNTHPTGTPDAVVHGLFYSMSQSLYYIFCFRHEVLLSQGDVSSLKMGYQRITESSFNPLKFCLPTIVREFVRICADNEWYDYNELVKSNEKLVLAKSTFGGANQLEMFFPFDPYLLKYSSKYLDAYYVSWSAPDDEDEDEDDEGAFADDSSDSSDDAGNADDDDDDDDDDEKDGKESSDIDQLTHDFMHFTPDVERDISYHFSFD